MSLRLAKLGDDGGHVVDVERAGFGKNKPDPQQVQTGTHGAHDEIVEGSHVGAAPAVGDQRVAGQRGNFHKDVEIENIAGDCDAKKPGDQQREERVKVPLAPGEFGVHQAPGVNGSQQGNTGHGNQKQSVQIINSDLDANDKGFFLTGYYFFSPAAEPIFLSASIGNDENQLQRRSKRNGQANDNQRVGQPGAEPCGKRSEYRAQQRAKDDDDWQMLRHFLWFSRISSSSKDECCW
jgi:hypothetical protein